MVIVFASYFPKLELGEVENAWKWIEDGWSLSRYINPPLEKTGNKVLRLSFKICEIIIIILIYSGEKRGPRPKNIYTQLFILVLLNLSHNIRNKSYNIYWIHLPKFIKFNPKYSNIY